MGGAAGNGTDTNDNVPNLLAPNGLNPTELASAYKIPASGGNGKIIAIVDTFDDPNAEKDLDAMVDGI